MALALPASAEPRPEAREKAQTLVATLEAKPKAKAVAQSELAKAKDALIRADRAHKAGDHQHATMLETVALEWATAANALTRTTEAETKATELEQKIQDVDAKTLRARALLEQTEARRARAAAQLKEAERALAESQAAANDTRAKKSGKVNPTPAPPASPAVTPEKKKAQEKP
jgi:hypothetical protein